MKGEFMNETIGKVAGRIWQILAERGEQNIAQIPKILKEETQITYMALGWLAREGKIDYTTKGSKSCVSLTPAELSIHQQVAVG